MYGFFLINIVFFCRDKTGMVSVMSAKITLCLLSSASLKEKYRCKLSSSIKDIFPHQLESILFLAVVVMLLFCLLVFFHKIHALLVYFLKSLCTLRQDAKYVVRLHEAQFIVKVKGVVVFLVCVHHIPTNCREVLEFLGTSFLPH